MLSGRQRTYSRRMRSMTSGPSSKLQSSHLRAAILVPSVCETCVQGRHSIAQHSGAPLPQPLLQMSRLLSRTPG